MMLIIVCLCEYLNATNSPIGVCLFSVITRKNVDDFTGPRERSDLGFVTFDLSADILCFMLKPILHDCSLTVMCL